MTAIGGLVPGLGFHVKRWDIELYPPAKGSLSIRTYDGEPGRADGGGFIVASAETLAYSVASGTIGDPRSFERGRGTRRSGATDRLRGHSARQGAADAQAPPVAHPRVVAVDEAATTRSATARDIALVALPSVPGPGATERPGSTSSQPRPCVR